MTVAIANVNVNTNNFLDWVSKSNQAFDAFANFAVTTNGNTAVGIALINGSLAVNAAYFTNIYGGYYGNTAPLTIVSNTVFSSNVSHVGSNNSFGAITNIHATGANATHKLVMANNSTGKLLYTSLLAEIVLVDGAGSNVDSDLLDGQQGAWYADIPARQGYVSANKAGDTFTGPVLGTSAAFSGNVSSNLVQAVSLYANTIAGGVIGTPAAMTMGSNTTFAANVVFNGTNTAFSAISNIYSPGSNATHKLVMANNTNGHLLFTSLLAEILLVDGASSGVDSDLLDGQHGSWYADIPSRQGYTSANKAGDTFTGAINGTLATFTGNVASNGYNGTFVNLTGLLTGNTATLTGLLTGNTATFSGLVTAASANVVGLLNGNSATFANAISGKTLSLTNGLTGNTATFTGNVAGDNGTFSGILVSAAAPSINLYATTGTVSIPVKNNAGVLELGTNIITKTGTTNVANTVPIVATTATLIHQFAKATWRSGKYIMSLADGNANSFTATELLVMHNSGNAFLTEYAMMHSNNAFGTFSANTDATNVRLYFTSTSNSATIKFDSTLIPT